MVREGAVRGPAAGTTFPNSRRLLAPLVPGPATGGGGCPACRPPGPSAAAGSDAGQVGDRDAGGAGFPTLPPRAAAPAGDDRLTTVLTPGALSLPPSGYLLAAAALLRAVSDARHVPAPPLAAPGYLWPPRPVPLRSSPPASGLRPLHFTAAPARPGPASYPAPTPASSGQGRAGHLLPDPATPRLRWPRPAICIAGPAPRSRLVAARRPGSPLARNGRYSGRP